MKRGRRTNASPSVATFRQGDEEFIVVSWPIDETPTALSAAERDVASLVAEGKTNAEIARARRTSIRTIANQVAAILRKLGVPSRHHVARVVHRPQAS